MILKLKSSEKIIGLIRFLAAVILGVLVIAVFINVVLRFGFASGFVATEELSRILLVWLIFGGAIVVLHGRNHISMTMAVEKLPHRIQWVLALLGPVLMIFCDVLLIMGAYRQVTFSLSDYYPVSGLPVAVSYLPGVLAAGAFAIINLASFIRMLSGRLSPQEYFGLTDQLDLAQGQVSE
jgi:TRAP-type C4-dicarboxylate transport system permease small subunit